MKYLLTSFLLLASLGAFAQKRNIYFMNSNGEKVDSEDKAQFVRIVVKSDPASELFKVTDYYKNGNTMFTGSSSNVDGLSLKGSGISYYPDGKKKLIANYNNGIQGVATEYYHNGKIYFKKDYVYDNVKKVDFLIKYSADSTGKATVINGSGYFKGYDERFEKVIDEGPVKDGLKEGEWTGYDTTYKVSFVEHYKGGLLESGVSKDSSGETVTYQKRSIPAQFPGGFQEFYDYLVKAIHYPADARSKGITGKAFIRFYIEKDGSLSDFGIIRAPSKDIGEEALRVMKLSSAWIPGKEYGRIARQEYTIPIAFSLQSF